ncbi:MAG TPA: HlyD family efflux transporter periplasmic adaptor subunit [Planctomycetaceae bacterium]|nr:HlyD family efflux transporter periplasmic adaptor subunit [Planctomycetaceae bacterium]
MAGSSTEVAELEQKHQAMLAELQRLAQMDIGSDEFYTAFLQRVVAASAAVSGGIWLHEGDGGGLNLRYRLNYELLELKPNTVAWDRHGRLLLHVLQTRRGGIVAPLSGNADANPQSAANPTDFYLNLCPVALSAEHFGVIELVHKGELDSDEQSVQIRFLHRACEFLLDYQKSQEIRKLAAKQKLWTQLDSFVHDIHESLSPKKVAYTVANDGRQLIGCDRVSVALLHGKRAQIEAISGQAMVDRRANMVRTMSRLANAVVHAGETLHYTGGTENLPPRIERLLREYLEECGSKAVFILPVREPQHDETKPAHRPFGAIVVEQIDDIRDAKPVIERSETVARHSAMALLNARRHHQIFLRPVLHWIGQTWHDMKASTVFKLLAVPAVLAIIIAALVLVPAPFRLEGKGRLLPEVRRNVFAGEDGVVRELFVKHGDRVQTGDPLLKLENIDLAVKLQQSKAELIRSQDEFHIKNALRGHKGMSESEAIQLTGELIALEGKVESLKREVGLLEEKMRRLTVRAPMDGVITTWDLAKNLADRPVTKGSILLHEADEKSPWFVEVRMAEDRIGHILKAQEGQKEPLPVDFILATQPEIRYHGKLVEIGKRTEYVDQANIVLLTIALEPEDLPPLRPGAEVRARIECGERPVGYVWFHELLEFVYARVLFLF